MAESSGTGEEAGRTAISRRMWVALVAMTLASSMILVDQTAVPLATPDALEALDGSVDLGQWLLTANILPLAAFMVLGGRLGDLLGLRRVFVVGAAVFLVATALAGAAQDMPWILAARAAQGCGAALMMPTAVAIVSAVFPADRRGMALGVLAGGSACFAASGPVLGGALTSLDWRLVFLVNVPLAALAIALTLRSVPAIAASGAGSIRKLDYGGVLTLAIGSAGLVFGLSQLQGTSILAAQVLVPLAVAVIALTAFVAIELRAADPLLDLRLFRHLNFLAANLSQVLAGAVELGMGFLLPFFYLLVIGVSPAVAGIALIPATIPIILAGPLAGRAFDRIGGRAPMTIGFLALAVSGVALFLGAPETSVVALIPGLLLQGIGLGIVLTVNDPVGLSAVPERDRGTAAGMINTSEQLGGALGIAVLVMVELSFYKHKLFERLAERGIDPTDEQVERFKEFILEAEQVGLGHARESRNVQVVIDDVVQTHVDGFQLAFLVAAAIALLGALVSLALVRRQDRLGGPLFARRSRWVLANVGASPGLTRRPPGAPRSDV